ncbi:unnamed protein product, partial [Nesidiocoris tenuis]
MFFDLVKQVEEGTSTQTGLKQLKHHPSVKRVTPQRLVVRNLTYVNNTDYETNDAQRPFKK